MIFKTDEILQYNTPDSYRDDSRLEQFYWSITDILSVLVAEVFIFTIRKEANK